MDASLFTDRRTGDLLQITTLQGRDWSFTPRPLPPLDWKLPDSSVDLLIEAWDSVGAHNGIGRTLPNPELPLRPLQEREALQSSALEGTYATPEEVLLFVKHPTDPKSESDKANGWRELHNYTIS